LGRIQMIGSRRAEGPGAERPTRFIRGWREQHVRTAEGTTAFCRHRRDDPSRDWSEVSPSPPTSQLRTHFHNCGLHCEL